MTPEMPARIARLPRDRHDRPVPWFVAWVDDAPDFRVIGPGRLRDAIRFDLCWICGHRRGRNAAFVIGPMCVINRVSAEPGSHLDCAVYAAQACPFLTTPRMRRRDSRLPDGHADPAGMMIRRNPGVAVVWVSRTARPFPVGDGVLFDVGDPVDVRWYAEGRPATRAEVLESIDTGLPLLLAEAEHDGADAVAALHAQHDRAMALLPS